MAEGETFRFSMIGQGNAGTAIVFDFGFVDLTSGTGHVDTGIAAGDFQTLVQAKIVACLPTEYTVKRYRCACVGGTHKGEIGYVEVDPPVAGGVDGDYILPAEMAISLKRSTGYSSRKDRGRVFFGPVCSQFHDAATNIDFVVQDDANLNAVRDLLKTNLTTQTRVLHPVILAADGTYSGRTVCNVSIGQVFVHRKTRRFRVGV